MRSKKLQIVILAFLLQTCIEALTQTGNAVHLRGVVLDSSAHAIAGARVAATPASGPTIEVTTAGGGEFDLPLPRGGRYTLSVAARGFAAVSREIAAERTSPPLEFRLAILAPVVERVVVSAEAGDVALSTPDPGQKVMVREELLDANPGRPGAPVSLPGYPIETASGGIKAPQYFVPGVAGDHGEPIAQYIAVGSYIVPNNLSANAHGNGYADPNLFIPAALGSVETDGGAFNVLEGNHSLNLAATYSFRPQLKRFVTLTADLHDLDLTAGLAPENAARPEWIGLEAAFGNGLLQRLEHRQQYKWNAMRVYRPASHELTLLSIGYYGSAYQGGLVPLGLDDELHDTIDPRQRDQTHTALLAGNDAWKLGRADAVYLSGFFRTYNLSLFSNFGEGLIRQSEFRTVTGAQAREQHRFTPWLEGMAGTDFNEDLPRRDNLDHYLSANARVYGNFVKVLANNLLIRNVSPYGALHGDIGAHIRFYAGLRADAVEVRNTDLLRAANSFDRSQTLVNPKATLVWSPGPRSWMPTAAFSMGQAFFTEDPRIGVATANTAESSPASPFERSHAQQLMIEKAVANTDVRITAGLTTTTATLAKVDADTGLPEDLGPGKLKFLTLSARRQFRFGSLQGVLSKADARDMGTGMVTPEAPRTIFDGLAVLDRLPLAIHARAEYEYVGHKLLDAGGYEAVPVKELRAALVRSFVSGRLELGMDGMFARGYTGQTTEMIAPDWQPGGAPPFCSSGASGIGADFDCGSIERAVGVRLPSYVGASISWRLAR